MAEQFMAMGRSRDSAPPTATRATEGLRLEWAIALAASRHEGQKDKAGQPYIRHPLRVMERVARYGTEYMVVAVLHDVIEDTGPLTPLAVEGLTQRQRDALRLLTRSPEDTYAEYIERIAMARIDGEHGRMAGEVKVADLRDNLARLYGIKGAEVRNGLRRRYFKALHRLTRGTTDPDQAEPDSGGAPNPEQVPGA